MVSEGRRHPSRFQGALLLGARNVDAVSQSDDKLQSHEFVLSFMKQRRITGRALRSILIYCAFFWCVDGVS